MSHGSGKYDIEKATADSHNRNAGNGNGDHFEMASDSVPTSPMTPSATDEDRPLLRRTLTPAVAVKGILTSQKSTMGGEGQGDVADTSVDDGDIELGTRTLFCQMDILCHFDDNSTGWKESARWLKYEEKVEDVGRWSKPHVSIAYLHALQVIHDHIKSGTAVLELDLQGMDGTKQKLADVVVSKLRKEKSLSEDACHKLRDILIGPHKHAHRAKDKVKGDRSSEVRQGSDNHLNGDVDENRNKKGQKRVYEHNLYPGTLTPHQMKPYEPNKNLMKKIPSSSEVANILVGHVTFLSEPIIVFLRLEKAIQIEDMSEIASPTRFLFVYLGPPPASATIKEYEELGRAAATLLTDKVFCEVAYRAIDAQDIVYGIEEYLDEVTVLPPSVWDPNVRLAPPKQTRALNKIANRLEDKTKHVACGDEDHEGGGAASDETLARTGKLFGGFKNDVKRRYALYWSDIRDAFHVQSIAAVIFLFFACVTPIVTFGGMMGQATDNYMGTMECILAGTISGILYHTLSAQPLTIVGATGPLLVFETILYVFSRDYEIEFLPFRFWVGFWVVVILLVFVAFDLSFLVAYITRFTEEAFACLISIIFIYEAIVNLLKILGTHPVYVDKLLHNRSYGCLCMPHSNVSDSLSTATLTHTTTAAAIMTSSHDVNATTPAPMVVYSLADWTQRVSESCVTYLGHVVVETGCISESNCTNHGWDLHGDACNIRSVTQAVPDVFFLSWLLALGTLGMAVSLKNFRNSPFFPSFVRTTVSDFAVFLAIVNFTLLDYYFRLDTPKLLVPNEVKTTRPDRGWLVNPVGISQPYIFIPLAIIPAALAVILIFLDHQITCVIINRAEHKLKKGGGYHLDLATVSLLVLVCSILGLPWFVAATVRSLNHVRSLMKESEVRIPGEKPQFMGVREQRVTGIVIHILIGLSALLTSVLQLVPMPVLYGVFLYMGISSLAGVQFIQRIMLMFMPSKYQPDYAYLRHVKLTRVHIFTLLQILCMAGMWIVKSIKAISIGFPIMVLALCVMRKAMDYIFTQHELFWLDHLLPEQERRKKEDEEELQEKQTTWETEGSPAAEYEYTGGARKKSMDIINRRVSRDQGGGLAFKSIDE